jgi:hypothetical protein
VGWNGCRWSPASAVPLLLSCKQRPVFHCNALNTAFPLRCEPPGEAQPSIPNKIRTAHWPLYSQDINGTKWKDRMRLSGFSLLSGDGNDRHCHWFAALGTNGRGFQRPRQNRPVFIFIQRLSTLLACHMLNAIRNNLCMWCIMWTRKNIKHCSTRCPWFGLNQSQGLFEITGKGRKEVDLDLAYSEQ